MRKEKSKGCKHTLYTSVYLLCAEKKATNGTCHNITPGAATQPITVRRDWSITLASSLGIACSDPCQFLFPSNSNNYGSSPAWFVEFYPEHFTLSGKSVRDGCLAQSGWLLWAEWIRRKCTEVVGTYLYSNKWSGKIVPKIVLFWLGELPFSISIENRPARSKSGFPPAAASVVTINGNIPLCIYLTLSVQ